MFRIIQTIQNLFLRIEGIFGLIWQNLTNLFGNVFGSISRVLGFSQSNYFLESDAEKDIKPTTSRESIPKTEDKTPETFVNARRSNAKVGDYYLNMARDLKKS